VRGSLAPLCTSEGNELAGDKVAGVGGDDVEKAGFAFGVAEGLNGGDFTAGLSTMSNSTSSAVIFRLRQVLCLGTCAKEALKTKKVRKQIADRMIERLGENDENQASRSRPSGSMSEMANFDSGESP
jgi:hypothetical protein